VDDDGEYADIIGQETAQVGNDGHPLGLQRAHRRPTFGGFDPETQNLDGEPIDLERGDAAAGTQGFFDTFMGLPRAAVIGFLKDNNNAIDVAFTVQGDTSNPNFSLNENLPTRIAASMAGTLGVSIINVAEGFGSLGRKGMEGAGSVVEGVGAAIKSLFGSKQ